MNNINQRDIFNFNFLNFLLIGFSFQMNETLNFESLNFVSHPLHKNNLYYLPTSKTGIRISTNLNLNLKRILKNTKIIKLVQNKKILHSNKYGRMFSTSEHKNKHKNEHKILIGQHYRRQKNVKKVLQSELNVKMSNRWLMQVVSLILRHLKRIKLNYHTRLDSSNKTIENSILKLVFLMRENNVYNKTRKYYEDSIKKEKEVSFVVEVVKTKKLIDLSFETLRNFTTTPWNVQNKRTIKLSSVYASHKLKTKQRDFQSYTHPANEEAQDISRFVKNKLTAFLFNLSDVYLEHQALSNHPNLTSLPYYGMLYRVVGSVSVLITLCIGISGNLMVVILIIKWRSMHTPTNCYLLSLALADLIILLFACLPTLVEFHMPVDHFIFGDFACKLMVFSQYLGVNLSSLSITAFTVERFATICHPVISRRSVLFALKAFGDLI